MNAIWSTYLQRIGTLYQSRQLRFDDRFRQRYMDAFRIDPAARILEIGAGPGALAQALRRWYPESTVIGSDRDAGFIEFAMAHSPDIEFTLADIASLPFAADAFDVVISNTVQEHVDPDAFFGEQYRLLRSGGVCLVLSVRRGIHQASAVVSNPSDFEREMEAKLANAQAEMDARHGVGRYACTEQELPALMAKYGFRDIETHYAAIDLTPDSGQYDRDFALRILETNRRVSLDSLEIMERIAPDAFTQAELRRWADAINARFEKRIALYDAGQRQWDTNVTIVMILRGVK